jgi:hypothetical protein
MNRRLIWIIAGVSVLGLGVPAFAAARGGDGTPEDNGVPGDVSGNCDEAEHANDPECLAADPTTATIVVTVPATLPATVPATVPTTVDSSVPDVTTPGEGTAAAQSVPENTTPGDGTVTDTSTPVNSVEDVSGPCDEAEHADDPRCTGAPRVDNSGPGNINDDAAVEDNSGRGNGDDDGDDADDDSRSGRGGGDDSSNDSSDDGGSRHGGDDD